MSDLETLKAQHPEWCWRCGDYTGNGDCFGCIEHPVMAAMATALQHHEATIAEQGVTISVLDGDLQNAKCDLTAALNSIAERDATIKEKDARIAELEVKLEKEECDCLSVISQRDGYHEKADALTEAIARHLDADFGEHSSANSPWDNAIEALAEAGDLYAEQQDHAATREELRKAEETIQQQARELKLMDKALTGGPMFDAEDWETYYRAKQRHSARAQQDKSEAKKEK